MLPKTKMAGQSKADYLKRYLSGADDEKKKKKKKRKLDQPKALKARTRIIDDDIDLKALAAEADAEEVTVDDIIGENDPTVAEVVDERPEHIKRLEQFRTSERWRLMGKDGKNNDFDGGGYGKISASDASPKRRQRHDSDDNSPPRSRQRHDSDDSPPRGRLGSDSDQSPPRTKRGKSEDSTASPPRKNRHDSDESPPRRRQENSDSDRSPPRRKRNDSDSDQSPPRRNRQNADSDQSPPRRKRQDSDQSPPRRKRHNADSDQSPPRRKRQNSDSDQSPPRRRKTGGGDSDSSPPRKNKETKATKTLSGAKAGLSSAREMKHEAERVKRREAEAFGKVDEDTLGKNATTVFRDRGSGRRRDFKEEKRRKREEESKKAEEDEKYLQWGKGMKQAENQKKTLEDTLHEMSKPLARYKNDSDLDDLLKDKDREGDPMLAFLKKKKGNAKGNGKEKPKYRGPAPPPNRFNIMPGYRWDGVDRSNGFEKEFYSRISQKKATAEDAFKWSVEDM